MHSKGLGLAAISYDSPEILAAFSRQRGITFPLLSDQGSATIRAFGILNTVTELGLGPEKDDTAVAAEVQKYVAGGGARASDMMRGMAFPGTLMIDRRGRVTSRFFEDSYVDRLTFSSVMVKAGGASAPVNATKISSAQVDVTAFASDSAIAPGNRFSLVLDVTPRRGMHVYAPGAANYRVISLVMNPETSMQLLPIQYPRSEVYFFKPLNERVPVYQKPFRLIQDVILLGTPQAQAALKGKDSLTLSGSLEYQACDDKVCFNPASVPVTWTFAVRPLIRERPTIQQK